MTEKSLLLHVSTRKPGNAIISKGRRSKIQMRFYFPFRNHNYHLMMDKKTGKGCSLSKSFSVVLLTLALMMRDPQTYVI